MKVIPRVIRAKDAPAYLGMSRSVFDLDVKPHLTIIPIGKQGIGFDRLDLDAWLEHHKKRNGCPAKSLLGGTPCQNQSEGCQVSDSVTVSGTLRSKSRDMDHVTKALERATLSKRKTT